MTLRTVLFSSVLAFGHLFSSNAAWCQSIAFHDQAVSVPDDADSKDAEAARIVVGGFAECLVGHQALAVRRYLKLEPGSRAAMIALGRIATSDCLSNGELRFRDDHVRGPLYAALFRKEFSASPDISKVGPIKYAADFAEPTASTAEVRIMVREFADCVVRADPKLAFAIVRGPAGSKAESSAFVAIRPHFGPCLYQGMKVPFSKTILVSLIDEAAYRIASETRSQAGAR